eukprot:11228140-Alexandrium_andersonii.AAC.1
MPGKHTSHGSQSPAPSAAMTAFDVPASDDEERRTKRGKEVAAVTQTCALCGDMSCRLRCS